MQARCIEFELHTDFKCKIQLLTDTPTYLQDEPHRLIKLKSLAIIESQCEVCPSRKRYQCIQL